MSGFGLFGFGLGPVGLGTPITASAPPDGPAGCRYINPATRDFEQDPETGQLKQMPPIRQRVLLALTTIRGSASTRPDFGFRLPRKMGDRFGGEATNAVKTALRQLLDVERLIRLDGVTVEKGRNGRGRITVSWTVIANGQRDSATV